MNSRKTIEIRIKLFLLGLISMSTQVIMLREILAIFHGNELIIGLFLGIWMGLTAGGAFLSGEPDAWASVYTPPEVTSIQMRLKT